MNIADITNRLAPNPLRDQLLDRIDNLLIMRPISVDGLASSNPGGAVQAFVASSGGGLDPIDEMINLLGEVQSGDLQDLRAVGDRIKQANEDKKLLRQMLSDAADGKFDKIQDTLDAHPGLKARLEISSSKITQNEGESTKDATNRITDYLKGISDNVGDLTQELTFELQTIMTRINQATQLRSNMFAKDSAAKDAVIGNIRG